MEKLIDEKQLAAITGLALQTLRNQRHQRRVVHHFPVRPVRPAREIPGIKIPESLLAHPSPPAELPLQVILEAGQPEEPEAQEAASRS